MLSDTLIVQQSLINNFFYLRTMREFCLNIQLSFYETNQEEIRTAEEFGKRSEELGQRVLDLADGQIPKALLDSEIFFTKYTLEAELLTEKLFGVDINTELTEREIALRPNMSDQTNIEKINEIQQLNREIEILASNFIDFCDSLLTRMKSNEIFSYSYPAIINFMIREMTLYQRDLQRIIEKSGVDPFYILLFEYRNSESMRNIAQFIKGLSDPEQTAIIARADEFQRQYEELMVKYQDTTVTPENQLMLNGMALELTESFRDFVSFIIKRILNSELYFIIEPLFFDNLLTEINYFIYLLRGAVIGISQ